MQLAGYTELEKIEIAKRFLIQKTLKATGLTNKNATFADDAYETVIRRYTREAGVRSLEREIASICRKIARKVVMEGKDFAEEITTDKVTEYLGVPRYRPMMAEEENEIGIATGLAWTEAGGELLVTESTLHARQGPADADRQARGRHAGVGAGRHELRAGKSRRAWHPKELQSQDRRPRARPGRRDPEGWTVSRNHDHHGHSSRPLAGIPTRRDVAMTGEITLRGKVLPIGGVKEKVLAAHRAGLKTIILPKDNEKDLADIPKNVLDSLDLYMVDKMDEVLKIALAEPMRPLLATDDQPEQPAASDALTH